MEGPVDVVSYTRTRAHLAETMGKVCE
ncbi:MAG: hypothetical protein HW416_3473, partial [Chloroflexi bacterium]|nr:hypothetical protein [Chloroflexota bacterium]